MGPKVNFGAFLVVFPVLSNLTLLRNIFALGRILCSREGVLTFFHEEVGNLALKKWFRWGSEAFGLREAKLVELQSLSRVGIRHEVLPPLGGLRN